MRLIRSLLPALLTAFLTVPALATEYRTESLTMLDRQFLEHQRERIDQLARSELGERVRGEVDADLRLLQTLLDRRLVEREDAVTLQAMGVVLGDLLAAEYNLRWVIYVDREGRSRALEVPGTSEFMFPVTLISRRYSLGAEVDVRALYQRSRDIVEGIRERQHYY